MLGKYSFKSLRVFELLILIFSFNALFFFNQEYLNLSLMPFLKLNVTHDIVLEYFSYCP